MKLHRFFYIAFLSALLFSCKQKPSEPSFNEASSSEESATSESATTDEASDTKDVATSDAKSTAKMASSSAAVVDKNSNRKFIRTADLKFKVTDVATSTYAFENTVTKMGGFVASTELKSTIINTSSAQVSNDSIVETTRFIVENNMVIRIPNILLDSTIKVIAKQIDFLDYRIIKADDVSLQLLSNQLSQRRNQLNQTRVEDAIRNRGRKLGETLDAEDRLYNSQTQSDEAKLSTLSMNDQINFSTIALAFYQKESIKTEKLANPDNEKYRTGFGVQLSKGLKNGWYILEAIIVFLVNIWTLIALAGILWFVWKKFKKTKS
jgi:hypothetical protein